VRTKPRTWTKANTGKKPAVGWSVVGDTISEIKPPTPPESDEEIQIIEPTNPLVRLLDPTPLTPIESGTLRNTLRETLEEAILQLSPGAFVEHETLVRMLTIKIKNHFKNKTHYVTFEMHCKQLFASLAEDGLIKGQEGPAESTGPNPLVRLLDPTPLTPEETGTLRNILWDRAEEIFHLTPGQFVEDETLVEKLADTITDHFEELTQVDAFEEHCKQLLASLTKDGLIEGNEE